MAVLLRTIFDIHVQATDPHTVAHRTSHRPKMPGLTLRSFLRSFDPSLAYLHPMFARAQIDNEAALMSLTSWGPYHVDNSFPVYKTPKPVVHSMKKSAVRSWTASVTSFVFAANAPTRFLRVAPAMV
ncbi:hypothetical protein B0H14DRAFT_3496341 [Mycena olivaceomarginata]|nr:hypothetical protein B0H14DRAFT_3496341 [Mycena olivaceomarginata]